MKDTRAGVEKAAVAVPFDGNGFFGSCHAPVAAPEAGPVRLSSPSVKIGGFCRAGHRFVQCATLAGTFRRTIKEPTYHEARRPFAPAAKQGDFAMKDDI